MKKICDAARAKGVKTVVDGAHAFAHFPYKAADLGCDFYGTSLHKWLLAPIGTGFLYVRRENIESLWALTPTGASAREGHPQVRGDRHAPGREPQRDRRGAQLPRGDGHRAEVRAPALPAQPLGDAAAEDRPLQDPHADGSGAVVRDRHGAGRSASPTGKAVQTLWDKWRIIATPIVHAEYEGIRVTPNVYTTLEEIDTFAEAMESLLIGLRVCLEQCAG